MKVFTLWRQENIEKMEDLLRLTLMASFSFKSPHKNNDGKLESIWAKNMRSYLSYNENNRGSKNFKINYKKMLVSLLSIS